ncbi:acid-sensing ion channel 3-like [Oculina patagonica]
MAFKHQNVKITVGHDPRNHDIREKESTADEREIEELKSFAQDTTLHGARFLFADNIFRRLLWALAIVACLVYCGYQVYTCVTEFYKRPFNTKMTTHSNKDDNELFFPAVTLCNLNTFNTRRFRQISLRAFNKEEVERQLRDISLLASRSKEVLSKEFIQRNPGFFFRPGHAKAASDVNKLIGLSKDILGYQIQEMILPSSSEFETCSINGKHCDARNVTSFINFMFGKCYTFNSAEGSNSLLPATSAGQNSGLKLRLNIERESYLHNTLNPFVGLAILIHDQKTFPAVEEFGIKIQPGVSTLCAIKRRKIIKLEKPYASNCTKRSLDVFESDSYTAYTKAACLLKCRNEYTSKICGCTPPEYKADPLVPVCAPNETVFCVYRSHEEFGASSEKKECEKDCPEPCEQVEYTTSFSYSGLLREPIIEHLMSWLNSTEKSSVRDRATYDIYKPLLNMTRAEREKYIDDNIVSLDIYFEDLSYNIIEQTPLFEIWALIGNLGGTFGLFLGMSFLTLLEFLDFTFRKISYLFHRQRNTRIINVENGVA